LVSAAFFSSALSLIPPAFAQGRDIEDCLPGEACGQAANLGSWGLIVLGVLSFSVALIPARTSADLEENKGSFMLSGLQARIEKETTGWRRFQWPLLGLISIGLGTANLLDWS